MALPLKYNSIIEAVRIHISSVLHVLQYLSFASGCYISFGYVVVDKLKRAHHDVSQNDG